MRRLLMVLLVVCAHLMFVACAGGKKTPTAPDPVEPTTRIVFMTIPTITLRPNAKGAYPAVPSGLGTGTVEVIVDTTPASGAVGVYVFKLPPLNTPEYVAMREKWSRCVFYAEIPGSCEGAVAVDLSQESRKVLRLAQSAAEANAGWSYHSVFHNRGSEEVRVSGEYAYTPS